MAKYTKLVKLTYSIISRLHNIGVIYIALPAKIIILFFLMTLLRFLIYLELNRKL